MDIEILMNVLEKSIEKNGDKPLTMSHLLNIIRYTLKIQEKEEEYDPIRGYVGENDGCFDYK